MEKQESISFYSVIQQKVDSFLQKINLSSKEIIQYVTIFGLGFLIGMLFKRYGTMIISCFIGILLLFSVLSYINFISVHVGTIKSFLHIEHVNGLDDLFAEIRSQVSKHTIETLLAIISIIIGFKLG